MTTAELPAQLASLREPIADPPARNKIRALIVDDQLVEREVMRRMLKSEPDIEIVGASANGREAVEAIEQLRPDLVFLDVQMPELDGFGVVSKLDPARMPAVIFITANHEFALKAFEVQALDYLIKPCARDRFKVALERARAQIRRRQAGDIQQRLSELLAQEANAAPRQPERLAIKSQGRILFLRSNDIDWVEAADNYVKLHVGRETHPLRDTMTALEKKLPANRFLRISRSTIVNVDQIKELHSMLHGEHTVVLRNGTRLTLTRGYRDKLRQLGL
jgi:two-component system LytT family response regulator